MKPLQYHAGQTAIQEEAQTTRVAQKLADWVGPVADFARGADMLVFALRSGESELQFAVLSGAPPLVEVIERPEVIVRLPASLAAKVAMPAACGGLAINLGLARRSRINGHLYLIDGVPQLVATEAFTLCRKYFAPSVALEQAVRIGPATREPLAIDDAWLGQTVARAETSFLASVSPDGMPDVAHRGGKPGFLVLDGRSLRWTEYIGDGIFKSAGNLRATGTLALLVPDLATGDGVLLHGRGAYSNSRTGRAPREDALVQDREDYPAQGAMTCQIARAERLRGLLHPRQRIERAPRVTSRSAVSEQKPQ